MIFSLNKWIFYSIIFCSYPHVCEVANQPSSSRSEDYLQVTDDILTKSQSYNKLVNTFRENWESPFTYLVHRGYIPEEEAIPNKFSRNAIEEMQKKFSEDSQDAIDLSDDAPDDLDDLGSDNLTYEKHKDVPRDADLEKICNISIPTLPDLTTRHPPSKQGSGGGGGGGGGGGSGGGNAGSKSKTVTPSPDDGECEEYYDDVTECYYVDDDDSPPSKTAGGGSVNPKDCKPNSSGGPGAPTTPSTTTTTASGRLPICKLNENGMNHSPVKYQYQYHPSRSQNDLLSIQEQNEANLNKKLNALKLSHKNEPSAFTDFFQNSHNKSLVSKYPLVKIKRTEELTGAENKRKKTDVKLPPWYSSSVNLLWPPFDVPYQSASRVWHYYDPSSLTAAQENSAKASNVPADHPGNPHPTQPSRPNQQNQQGQPNQQNQKGAQNPHNEQPQKVPPKAEPKAELKSESKAANDNFLDNLSNLGVSSDQSPKIIGKELILMTNDKGDPLSKPLMGPQKALDPPDVNEKSNSEKPNSYIALNAVYILHRKPEENIQGSNSPSLNAKEIGATNAERPVRDGESTLEAPNEGSVKKGVNLDHNSPKLPDYSSDNEDWTEAETNNQVENDDYSSLSDNPDSWMDLINDPSHHGPDSNEAGGDSGDELSHEMINDALTPIHPINIWSEAAHSQQDENPLSFSPVQVSQLDSRDNTKSPIEDLFENVETISGANFDSNEFDDAENDSRDNLDTNPLHFLDSLGATDNDFASTYQHKNKVFWPKSKTYEETVSDLSKYLNSNAEPSPQTSHATNDEKQLGPYESRPFQFKTNREKASENSYQSPENLENINNEFLKLMTYENKGGQNSEDTENADVRPQHDENFSDTMSKKYEVEYKTLSKPEQKPSKPGDWVSDLFSKIKSTKGHEQSSNRSGVYDDFDLDENSIPTNSKALQKSFERTNSDDNIPSGDPKTLHQSEKNILEENSISTKAYDPQNEADMTTDGTSFDSNRPSSNWSQESHTVRTSYLKPNHPRKPLSDLTFVTLPKQPKRTYAYTKNYPSDDILNLYRYKNMHKDLEQYFHNDQEAKPTPRSYTKSQIRTALQISRELREAAKKPKLLPEYESLVKETAKNIIDRKFPSVATEDLSNESAVD